MNVLILGGESPRHQQWVRDVAEAVKPHADKVAFLDYRHWQDNSPNIDLEHEISQAVLLFPVGEHFIVIAKSIGSVIATLATGRGLLEPDRCIFMGFPLAVVTSQLPEVGQALPLLPPTIFLQNTADPLGGFQTVQQYLEAHAPQQYGCRELPGDSHNYVDFKLISDLLTG